MNFADLSQREKVMVGGLGTVLLGLLLYLGLFGVRSMVSDQRDENQAVRAAIQKIQVARTTMKSRQARKEAIAAKYAKKAPKLGGFLEQIFKEQEITPPESTDKPEAPAGKKFMERVTNVKLKGVGGLALLRSLEKIEQSGHPVAITRMHIRKKPGEHDTFDVELGVSAYDKNDTAKSDGKEAPASSAAPGATK